jgi:hypothetical protein
MSKAICFHCHYVARGVSLPKCPQCGYPLIQNTKSARLPTQELTDVFEELDGRRSTAPLPGVREQAKRAPILVVARRPDPEPPKRVPTGSGIMPMPKLPIPVISTRAGGTTLAMDVGQRAPAWRIFAEVAMALLATGVLVALGAWAAL